MDNRIENERENSPFAENFSQDIIESSQPSVVPKKRNRLDNCNSDKCIVGSRTTEFFKPVSSQEPRIKKLSLNSLESCVELGNKSSGNYLSKSFEKKDRKKRRIPFIVYSDSHSNRDYDIIVDEKPNYQIHVESNHTNHDKDRNKSKSKLKHRSSWDTSFPDFLSPIEIQRTDNVESKSEISKKDGKRKRKEKVEKKIANTTPAMIPDSASSSDDQTQETNDCFIASLNKGNTREHKKSRVGQTLSTSFGQEESYSSNTKHFRKFIPIPNSDRTSDTDRSKCLENDRDCSQDHPQSFEFVKVIRSEKLPTHTASNCSSPNISLDNLKMKPDVIGENKKHEAREKVQKKKANTLLAMIHDVRSSSDSDNEIQTIDDCSIATLNEGNTREHNKPRVGQILSTGVKEEGSHSSHTNHFRKFIPIPNSNKTSDNDRSKDQGNDEDSSQDHRQGFEFGKAISPEKLPVDIASNCGSPNTSLDVIRKDRKHKSKEKVKKKKTNTLLAMIHDIRSSSDSDDEIKKIDDCFVETSNKGNSKNRNQSGVSQILSTSLEEEESQSPNTKHFRKFIPIPNSDKNSDTDRSKGLENDRDCCQDNQPGLQFAKMIRSERWPADIAADCSSPDISVEDLETKLNVIRKDREHKSNGKVKKKKTNTLLAMIHDIRSSSDSDNEIQKIDDCSVETLNERNTSQHNKSGVSRILSTRVKEEESYFSNKNHFRKFIPIPNSDKTSDNDRSKDRENDKDSSQDNQQGFAFVKAIKSEKLPTHTSSNCSSPNISVDNLNMKPDVIGEDRKHEAKERVKKKKSNTLLAMIHDVRSSSDSDNEIQKIDDCPKATLNKGNTREHNKPKVGQILSTRVNEEGSHSPNTSHFRKFTPIPNSDKISDNDRSKDQGNDEDSSQDHRLGFEFVKAISPAKLPVDIASNCGSPNTSLDVIRKDRKHKSKDKVKKKKTNTLLAMIHDIRSSSDSDDEIKKIDDCSVETLKERNTRKRNKSGVSQILSTSFGEEESHSSNTKHFRKFIPNPNSNRTSDNDRSKERENDEDSSQVNRQGFELVEAVESEKLPADTASNRSSPNISVEDLQMKPDVIRKNREHKSNGKVKKKKTNTLLAMIHDISSSSDSDNEIQKIDDCSKATLNKGNTREHNKSRVNQILSTRVKEEESYSSNTSHFRKFTPIPNSGKTSDKDRSKDRENDEDSSQDNQQGFAFVKAIKSEKLPTHTSSNCSSPNISVDNLKMKPDVIGEDRKHEAKERVKKKKANTLLAMIHDVKSSSDSDNEIQTIDDCSIATLNEGNTREHNKPKVGQILSTRVKEEGSHSSHTNHFRKFIPIRNNNTTPGNDRSKDQGNDEDSSQDHRQGFEFVKAISPEKLPADIASNCGSPNTSLDVIRKDRKHKSKDKVKKKKTNTLLAMIHDIRSSSDSDDEIKKIDDCFVETSNKGNTKNCNKSGVSQILSTCFAEEEIYSSSTKHVRNFIPIPNSDKISESDRSRGLDNDSDCSQDNQQDFEFVKAIGSERWSADIASNCSSPNISVDDLKMKPQVIRKYRRREAREKVKRKKANTLQAMIHDIRSNSDLDDEIKKIDDSFEESVDKVNSRKSTKSRVNEIFEEEEGDESSREQPVENLSAIGRKFDLEVEAEDIEELISAIEEREQLPQETVTRLLELRVRLKHTVPPQHRIETYAGSRGPTPRQKKIIEKFGPIKYGKFAPGEDDIIVNNWKSFCELHDWDPSDYKPFLYMRHRKVGFIAKFSERLKFVQFLADGLPWRTLYSVYWRFRNLYQPHIHTKYTDEEDKLIIAHLENSSDKKNVRKYSELGKILNRTRSSVWKRYSLLSKKRNPCKKLEWNLHLVEKLIKNLIKLTLSNDVSQLKDLNIPLVVWKRLSKKFKIDNLKLKLFWQKKLHMQLFCQEPVYMNDVKIKLIEYFHATGISESWEIEWASIAKNFDGMTTAFLSRIFCGLVRHEKYQGMKFGEIIGHLYEVKKPELQKNRNDKCLPRIVFKDGNVKLLDVQADNRSKRKTVESENLSD